MVFLIQGFSDLMNQVTAVAFTFAGDALNVFGIDTKPCNSGFHRSVVLCFTKFKKQNEFLTVGLR